MSRKEKVSVPDEVNAAIASLRASKSASAYVVVGYKNKNTLEVVAQGEGGLDDARDAGLFPEGKCRYALFKKQHQVELATTVKFAFVDWTPTSIRPLRKGLLSAHKGQVKSAFSPHHVSLECSGAGELLDSALLEKIGFSSGTACHTTEKKGQLFLNKTTTRTKGATASAKVQSGGDGGGSSITAARKSELTVGSASAAIGKPTGAASNVRSGRPTGTAPAPASAPPTDAKRGGLRRKKAGKSLKATNGFDEAMSTLRSDERTDTTWLVARYPKKNTLELVGSGSGGWADLQAALSDTKFIQFAMLRVVEQIDNSATVKFVYFKVQPPGVSPMLKGFCNAQKGRIDAAFEPFHVDFFSTDPANEISEKVIMDKIGAASGSKSFVTNKTN